MKKFILTVLCVSAFFIGLGGVIENVGARFKSDERALEIVRLARQAIGGDANINQVQSLSISGKMTKIFNFDGEAKTEKGGWELNLQTPNKISKTIKFGVENPNDGEMIDKKVSVVIVKKAVGEEIVADDSKSSPKITAFKKGEGKREMRLETDGDPQIRRKILIENASPDAENFHRSELFRTMLFLLLTAPQNFDANYVYAGETTIDGANCEIVQVNSGSASVKLFFDKSSHLPVMASFTDAKPLIFRFDKNESNAADRQNIKISAGRINVEQAEFQIRFLDYRSVSGVQMPFKWTQTVDGNTDETIEVSNYEINPANIADKLKNEPQRIMIRTKKPE